MVAIVVLLNTESSGQWTSLPGPWHWTETLRDSLLLAPALSGGKSATACHGVTPTLAPAAAGPHSGLHLCSEPRTKSCRHHQRQHPPAMEGSSSVMYGG